MRRLTALFAATLVFGVQALLTAAPMAGAGARPCSGRAVMTCCGAGNGCSGHGAAACAGHGGPGYGGAGYDGAGHEGGGVDSGLWLGRADRASAPSSPCLRPLGCGHSLPGVTIPALDPLVMPAPTASPVMADAARLGHDAPDTPSTFRPEPLAPPPRA